MTEEPTRRFQCRDCMHEWEVAFGGGRQMICPNCGGQAVFRTNPGIRPCRGGRGQRCRRPRKEAPNP